MRRLFAFAVAVGVMLSSFGSPVSAESNPDPLDRIRFTTNVTSVHGAHPNLEVGDVLIFELAVPRDVFIIAPQTPDDPDFVILARPDASHIHITFRALGRLSTVVMER